MAAESRILLVEDDPEIQDLFAEPLREEGYAVDVAGSAAEARRRLGDSGYALVIADWWLPDGDGIVLANEAAERGAKSFVLSGYALTLIGETAHRHELLRKPITPTELIEAVQRKIGAAGSGA